MHAALLEVFCFGGVVHTVESEAAMLRLVSCDPVAVLVLDDHRRPLRWVTQDHLARSANSRPLRDIGLLPDALVEPHATLSDTLNEMITARYSTAVVVDSARAYLGVVDIDTINESVRTMRSQEQQRLRALTAEEVPGL